MLDSVPVDAVFGNEKRKVTDLIHNILADEIIDGHELLRPFLICVPGTQFYRDCAAPSDLTNIVHAETKGVPSHFC